MEEQEGEQKGKTSPPGDKRKKRRIRAEGKESRMGGGGKPLFFFSVPLTLLSI